MAVTLTPAALQRADEWQRERLERMTRRTDHLQVDPDPIRPGGWIVRNPKVPYRIELVDAQGRCTCQHYLTWERCKHSALVETRR